MHFKIQFPTQCATLKVDVCQEPFASQLFPLALVDILHFVMLGVHLQKSIHDHPLPAYAYVSPPTRFGFAVDFWNRRLIKINKVMQANHFLGPIWLFGVSSPLAPVACCVPFSAAILVVLAASSWGC